MGATLAVIAFLMIPIMVYHAVQQAILDLPSVFYHEVILQPIEGLLRLLGI